MKWCVVIILLVLSREVRAQVSVKNSDSLQFELRDQSISDDRMDTVVYEAYDVSTKAYFPGGDTGLVKHLIRNFKFTDVDEQCQYKRVYLSFVIDSSSNITDVQLLRTSEGHETHEQEAILSIKSTSGLWVPATRNGKKVNVIYRAGIPCDAELRYNLKKKLGI